MDHKCIVVLIMFVCFVQHMGRGFTSAQRLPFNGQNMMGEPSSSMAEYHNKRDVEALLSFKRGISDPLGLLSNWTAHNSDNVCRWEGISCRRNTKRVVAISLPACELNGTLSPYIGNLSLLRDLDLSRNWLSGRIPPEVGQLKALGDLELSHNLLHGSIPKELWNCTRLQTLDMSANHLSGPIPPELGRLVQLELWDISSNNLSGPIPSEFGLLVGLQYLSLYDNALSGSIPTSLSNCTSLLQLQGKIPTSIGTLRNLRLLNLSGNQLEGPIPASLSDISTLEQLDLSKNNLSGKIPEELSKLYSLAVLDVSYNNLCGRIPTGTQFSTFNATSFQRNKCLYGCPLDSCNGKQNPGREPQNNSSIAHIKVGWLDHLDDRMSLMALGIGFGIGIWAVVGVFIFCKRAKLWVLGLPPNKPQLFYGVYRLPT